MAGAGWAGWGSLAFANDQVGWIGGTGDDFGDGRVIAQTLDGGLTWQAQIADETTPLGAVASLAAHTSTIAYALSNGLWSTADGGATWAPASQTSGLRRTWDLCFPTPSVGWTVGPHGTILKTQDGGQHWTAQQSGTTRGLHKVDFVNSSRGWAVGVAGTILRTRDGGAHWTKLRSGTTKTLWAVDFIDASHGWVAGDSGALLRTTNGGRNWSGSR